MHHVVAAAIAAGFLCSGIATAQDVSPTYGRLLQLSRQVAGGAEGIRDRMNEVPDKPGKIGERILRNILTEGATEREARDPVFQRFVESTDALVRAAQDMQASGNSGPDIDSERQFIRQFRSTEQVAIDVDRVLTRPSARQQLTDQVKPGLLEIRRVLPALSASREDRERRDFYHGTEDRRE